MIDLYQKESVMRTQDFVIGKWPQIFKHYGLPPVTGKNHYKGECPLCKQKCSFRIDNKEGKGTWICKCDRGDGWKLLMLTQKKEYAELAKEIDEQFGNTICRQDYNNKPADSKLEKKLKSMRELVGRGVNIAGTLCEKYFNDRGIFKIPTDGVKFADKIYVRETTKKIGAMISLATNDNGKAKYIHITYLDGCKKANFLPAPKKMVKLFADGVECFDSVAVRLYPIASTLGIAEGIETAGSAKHIYDVNTWAALNATLLKKFIAPKGVKKLIIFGDRDSSSATGEAAAVICANRNLLANNDVEEVIWRWPEEGDFNDVILQGRVVYEMRWARKKG